MALRKLYFVADIKERYHCGSDETARRYMRQMGAKGAPMFVTEEMISEWEDSKRKKETGKKPRMKIPPKGGMIIPGRKVG